jgi:aryl-alcohol dehydrogenase-like predicted oxidoreductase
MGQFEHFGNRLETLSQRYHATTAQIALAWLLTRSPIMLPLPGTSSRLHLEENIAAAGLRFTEEEMMTLERSVSQ